MRNQLIESGTNNGVCYHYHYYHCYSIFILASTGLVSNKIILISRKIAVNIFHIVWMNLYYYFDCGAVNYHKIFSFENSALKFTDTCKCEWVCVCVRLQNLPTYSMLFLPLQWAQNLRFVYIEKHFHSLELTNIPCLCRHFRNGWISINVHSIFNVIVMVKHDDVAATISQIHILYPG